MFGTPATGNGLLWGEEQNFVRNSSWGRYSRATKFSTVKHTDGEKLLGG